MNWSHYKCDLIVPDIVGGDLFQCNLGVFTVVWSLFGVLFKGWSL